MVSIYLIAHLDYLSDFFRLLPINSTFCTISQLPKDKDKIHFKYFLLNLENDTRYYCIND